MSSSEDQHPAPAGCDRPQGSRPGEADSAHAAGWGSRPGGGLGDARIDSPQDAVYGSGEWGHSPTPEPASPGEQAPAAPTPHPLAPPPSNQESS